MRKRAQFKMPMQSESAPKPQSITSNQTPQKKRFRFKKNWWISLSLIAIFLLVLFMNSYFNIVSEVNLNPDGTTLSNTFYLSGPDPYYNMRIVETTVETGRYPFYSENDMLLNYPMGRSGSRAPLFVMSAISFSYLLTPFMTETEALGFSMQFVSALFGALLIFPVYFIGKILFGKKAGLLAALLIAFIPIHIGGGHGSAFGLFDHDSINLFFYFLTFLFMIKSIKEKDMTQSLLYAVLAGIPLAALSLVWVEAQFLYSIIAVYAVVQLLIDLFTNKVEERFVFSIAITLFTGYLVSLPVTVTSIAQVMAGTHVLNVKLYLALGVFLFGGICILLKRKRIPWVLSYPTIAGIGVAAAGFLYVIYFYPGLFPIFGALRRYGFILYGSGIYGDKVSTTIAEAGTYNMSRTVMSFGPALYWLAWAGFFLLMVLYVKQKGRKDYLFIITLFIISIWLTSTAGRFLNDMVPVIALLSGWFIWFVISKIDYKQMTRNIRNAGGGLRGIRKGVKIYHIFGVLFVAFLVFLPNGFLALDAAVPSAASKNGTSNYKYDFFGEGHSSAFGSSSYKEQYWVDAFDWLSQQDTHIADPLRRPAFISWWDYGFYGVAVGGHPVVADNFQDGIPPAANFHTAKSEQQAIAVLIVRILEGDKNDNNRVAFSPSVIDTLKRHLGEENSTKLISWMLDPQSSPSQNSPIGAEYDLELSKLMSVGEQYPENAYYHDIVALLDEALTEAEVVWLYHELQQVTGYSIRYYGVEGYDEQIFNIFAYLGDKSNMLTALRTAGDKFYNPEDDFVQVQYTGYTVNLDGTPGPEGQWTAKQLNDMTPENRNRIAITGTTTIYKEDYFETMFYRTYIGTPAQQDAQGNYQIPQQQIPGYTMKHFIPVYISPFPYYQPGRSAVIIAKFYEGAFFNGTISCNEEPLSFVTAVVLDEFGFPHDNVMTDEKGQFNLIAPAGNITLFFSYGNEVFLKQITFNSTEDALYAPVTEAEATRRATNYSRFFDIIVNLSTLQGFVYEDQNNNQSYDPDIDAPLSDVTIHLEDVYFGRTVESVTTDANGQYTFTGLFPSKYMISAVDKDGYTLFDEDINIEPGGNSFNISKPKPAAIKGIVYIDDDEDGRYTTGEEASGVRLHLSYTTLDGAPMNVASITTDATGTYEFMSLMPGEYTLNATKQNLVTGYLDYLTTQTITLTANRTSWVNISLVYAPVIVSGHTLHNAQRISDIIITFAPDWSVVNNTAQQVSATSDSEGYYVARLNPGAYNVSGRKTQGATTVYSFTGNLVVTVGQGEKSYSLSLIKESVTVSGRTTYNGAPKGNMSLVFLPDERVENNMAIYATAMSNGTGGYLIELAPGAYNVSVEEIVNESGVFFIYTGSAYITVAPEDTPKTLNVLLTREEAV